MEEPRRDDPVSLSLEAWRRGRRVRWYHRAICWLIGHDLVRVRAYDEVTSRQFCLRCCRDFAVVAGEVAGPWSPWLEEVLLGRRSLWEE